MTQSNALLVKPNLGNWTLSEWGKFEANASYFDSSDLNHQIYVPERFVLGHFKERKDGFKLSRGGIFYRDSREVLQVYQEDLDNEKLEIVKSLFLSESVLESLAIKGKAYVDKREEIRVRVESVDQYFV